LQLALFAGFGVIQHVSPRGTAFMGFLVVCLALRSRVAWGVLVLVNGFPYSPCRWRSVGRAPSSGATWRSLPDRLFSGDDTFLRCHASLRAQTPGTTQSDTPLSSASAPSETTPLRGGLKVSLLDRSDSPTRKSARNRNSPERSGVLPDVGIDLAAAPCLTGRCQRTGLRSGLVGNE
jgi:hypothetical protein